MKDPYPIRPSDANRFDLTPRSVRPGWNEKNIEKMFRRTSLTHAHAVKNQEKHLYAAQAEARRGALQHPNEPDAFFMPITGYKGYRPSTKLPLAKHDGAFSTAAKESKAALGPKGMAAKLNPAGGHGKAGGIFNDMMERTLAATGGEQSSPFIKQDLTPRRIYRFDVGEKKTWILSQGLGYNFHREPGEVRL